MSLKAIKPISANAETPDSTETATAVLEPPTSGPAPLTTDQLLTLLVTLQQQVAQSQKEAADANRALAAAIVKTTEPREYVKSAKEIADEANNKLFDERAKELAKRQKANIQYEQSLCDHVAGCSSLSEQRDIAGRTSILWHSNDVNVDIGICTVCQRIFRPSDPVDDQGHNYLYWRKKPSFNKLSKAGSRTFMNPTQAAEESYLHDS